jgi:hypothetical protein
MICRAIRLGIEVDQLEDLARLFTFDNSDEFVRNYQQWDDARFMETLCPRQTEPPGKRSGELLQRLRSRRLLKQVYSDRIEDCDARVRESLKDLARPTSDALRDMIEDDAAQFMADQLGTPIAREFVIAHAFGIKSVRESAKNDEAEILVRRGSTPRNFSQESKLFESINAAFRDEFVEIYAPIEWPSLERRDEMREQWRLAFREIVTKRALEKRRTAP